MKCLCALAASLLALALTPAHSQTDPTRPIKLVNDSPILEEKRYHQRF